MKLSKKNIWVRLAYINKYLLKETDKIPPKTDLCCLFWRAIFVPPLFSMSIIPLVAIFAPIYGLGCAAEWLAEKNKKSPHVRMPESLTRAWEDSVINGWMKDFKNKTCTIVEITEVPPEPRSD